MLCCSLAIKIIGTAHIVCRQGRVYEMIQCPSMGPQQQTDYCRFAAMGPADRKIKKYRLIAAAVAGECGQYHIVSIRR